MKHGAIASELAALYQARGGLDPGRVVEWARKHPDSALHGRFTWDDTKAARAYRLWQARELIVEVKITWPDLTPRQAYVSVAKDRGGRGYVALVDVMGDEGRRRDFLAQALAEYERMGEKYRDLVELAGVRRAVKAAGDKAGRRGRRKAA